MENSALSIITTIISTLFTVIAGYLATKLKRREQQLKEQDIRMSAMQEGVLALLRDRIYQLYAVCKKRNYVDRYAIRNMDTLYNAYKGMGGNGAAENIYNKFSHFEIRNDSDEESF
jgi:hypothetical protein